MGLFVVGKDLIMPIVNSLPVSKLFAATNVFTEDATGVEQQTIFPDIEIEVLICLDVGESLSVSPEKIEDISQSDGNLRHNQWLALIKQL